MIDSLSSRFCYWQGGNGERYLFSQISADDIPSFSDCVLLLATEFEGQPTMRWIGEIKDLSPVALRSVAPSDLEHLSVYVHLLAGSISERSQIIQDLSHQPDRSDFALSA